MQEISSVFLTKPDEPVDLLTEVHWNYKEQFDDHGKGGNQIVNVNMKLKSLLKRIWLELLLYSLQIYKTVFLTILQFSFFSSLCYVMLCYNVMFYVMLFL